MSDLDLEPLVRGDADPLERTVLGSARADVPSRDAKAALLAALAPAPPPSDAPRGAPSLLRRFGARYAPGVALVVGAGAAALMSVRRDDADRRPEPHAGVVAVAPSASPAAPSITETPVGLSVVVEPPPSESPALAPPVPGAGEAAPPRLVPRQTSAAPRAVVRPSAESEEDSTLAREIARIGAARSALAADDPTRALSLLAAYDAEFPRGAFSVEVVVLRVEALARSGRADEARQLGARFLSQHPEGALARRVGTTLRGLAPASQEPELAPPRD